VVISLSYCVIRKKKCPTSFVTVLQVITRGSITLGTASITLGITRITLVVTSITCIPLGITCYKYYKYYTLYFKYYKVLQDISVIIAAAAYGCYPKEWSTPRFFGMDVTTREKMLRTVYDPLYETYTIRILTLYEYMVFCSIDIRYRVRHLIRHRVRHRIPFVYTCTEYRSYMDSIFCSVYIWTLYRSYTVRIRFLVT